MATIGSGTKPLVNLVSTATWRAVDIDQCFAAFAEQLGGVAWGSGIPLIYGGNLDSTNFATGMALEGRFLLQPRAVSAFTIHTRSDPDGSSDKTYVGMASADMVATSLHLGTILPAVAGGTASGVATVTVNGSTVATVTVDWATSATGVQYPYSSSAVAFRLGAGSKIVVDFSGVTFSGAGVCIQPTVTLVGYAELMA